MSVPQTSPQELKRRLDAGERLQILDVREPWECAIVHLAGSTNIPLSQIPARLGELDANTDVVALCKVGGRSLRAAQFLLDSGFSRVTNLAGGIDAWIDEVDPALPSY